MNKQTKYEQKNKQKNNQARAQNIHTTVHIWNESTTIISNYISMNKY